MRVFLGLLVIFQFLTLEVKAEKLAYFFDSSIQFDSKIPSPEEFLGYEIGSRITEHYRINAYFEKLASLSDRVSLIEIGKTHENRKIVYPFEGSIELNLKVQQMYLI